MVSIGAQFSTGDQGNGSRIEFWRSGFATCQNKACPSLTKKPDDQVQARQPSWVQKKTQRFIRSEDHVAGCRMNGDAYGTTVFTCTECGWKTSFQYDDASEPYYYETRSWNDRERNEPRTPPNPWAGVHVYNWLHSVGMDPLIISKCRSFNLLDGVTISTMNERQLQALKFTKQEVDAILEAVAKKEKEWTAK